MNGVLLLDKPIGPTSHDMVMFTRRLLRERKVGHAGTLDPFATGLLIVLVGQATKLSNYLLVQDKLYEATVRWGDATDTMDHTGRVVETCVGPLPPRETIAATLAKFVGAHRQLPPMYSAKKVAGKPLYESAREGIDVARQTNLVQIAALDLVAVDETAKTFSLRVHCSKGTYVRALADSLTREMGGRGCLTALRRLRSGAFDVAQALAPEQWQGLAPDECERRLLTLDDALVAFKKVVVTEAAAAGLQHGGKPPRPGDIAAADDFATGDTVRLVQGDGRLLALATARCDAERLAGGEADEWPFLLLRVFSSS